MSEESWQESTDSERSWSEGFFSFCRAFFETKNAHRYAYFLPLVLFFSSLFLGLVADDFVHYWRLHFYSEDLSFGDATLYLFEFFQDPNTDHIEKGTLPWWISEQTSISFFRPIAASTHWLDAVLWKDVYFLHHLHSLLWACLTIGVAHRVFVQLNGAGWMATFCTWIFACHDTHTMPFAWLANRSMSISFVFSLLAFSLYIQSQEQKKGAWRAILMFVFALFVAESSVSVLGLMIAWAWVYIPQKKQALLSLLPYLCLTVVWRVLHKSMGYGAKGMELYIDPANDPLLFIEACFLHFPILLLNLIAKVPSDLYFVAGRQGQILMALVGFLCTIGLLFVCRKVFKESPKALFWSASLALMLLPVCATYPQERLLFFASFSFSGLLLCLLNQHGGLLAKRLLILHLPLAALVCIPKTLMLNVASDFFEMGYHSIPEDFQAGQSLVFVNGPEFPAMYTVFLSILEGETIVDDIMMLSASPDVILTVRGAQEIEIQVDKTWFFFNGNQSFAVGDRIQRKGFEAIVEEVNQDNVSTRVRFVLDEPLHSQKYRWMKWVGDRYEEMVLPSPSDEQLYIPDPWAFTR